MLRGESPKWIWQVQQGDKNSVGRDSGRPHKTFAPLQNICGNTVFAARNKRSLKPHSCNRREGTQSFTSSICYCWRLNRKPIPQLQYSNHLQIMWCPWCALQRDQITEAATSPSKERLYSSKRKSSSRLLPFKSVKYDIKSVIQYLHRETSSLANPIPLKSPHPNIFAFFSMSSSFKNVVESSPEFFLWAILQQKNSTS